MNILTLVPAYGRDYTTKKAVDEAWREGKDFQIADVASPDCGRYTSSRDIDALRKENIRWVNIRYKSLSEVHVIKV